MYRNKPVVLKRNLKLKDLKYDIAGSESTTPRNEVLSAVIIGAITGLLIFVVSLAVISEILN
jgi:hypothetical protein